MSITIFMAAMRKLCFDIDDQTGTDPRFFKTRVAIAVKQWLAFCMAWAGICANLPPGHQ